MARCRNSESGLTSSDDSFDEMEFYEPMISIPTSASDDRQGEMEYHNQIDSTLASASDDIGGVMEYHNQLDSTLASASDDRGGEMEYHNQIDSTLASPSVEEDEEMRYDDLTDSTLDYLSDDEEMEYDLLTDTTHTSSSEDEDEEMEYNELNATETLPSVSWRSVLFRNSDFEYDLRAFQSDLKNLDKTRTMRSTLEILLIFNFYLVNSSPGCQCYLKLLACPCNRRYLRKKFTVMIRILESIFEKDPENLIKNFDSDFESDFKLHLLHSLITSLADICESMFESPQDILNVTIDDEVFMKKLNKATNYIKTFYCRHFLHNRKRFLQSSNSSREGHPIQLSIQHEVTKYYLDSACVGRFPHVFWRDTPLSNKISHRGSLEVIFINGKEERCCVCYSDGNDFQDNFAVFLGCNHLVCASCAERLFVDDTKSR